MLVAERCRRRWERIHRVRPREPRDEVIDWAQAVISNPSVVFLDTETTGLDDNAEIIDIALVDRDGAVLLDTLIRPARPIPWGASNVHGLFATDVAGAPTWSEIHALLMPLLANRKVIVFNAEYDRRLVHQCCAQDGLGIPACEWECAMLAHAKFAGEPGQWGKRFRWHKLDAAAQGFGIEMGGHRALGDAEAARQVVLAMAAEAAKRTMQLSLF